MIVPLIMAGGSGSRLWPLSRRMLPKQFLSLTGEQSMLQQTLGRLDGVDVSAPIVVCNEEHRFLAAQQLNEIGCRDATVVLEPAGRNTAPAIAAAALLALQQNDDPLLLVLAADHSIADIAAFHLAILQAAALARKDHLSTFGIVPAVAETGYGYIRSGEPCGDGFAVAAFVEKPDHDTAQAYVDSGEYYWNSGMFLFRASLFLEELERFSPGIMVACREAVSNGKRDLDFFRLDEKSFSACPSESIDYAVMEKTDKAVVVPLDAGWNDVGSWSALWDIDDKDEQNNATHGDVMLFNSKNCLVHGESRLVTVVGVENMVVIETKDAVMVADKSQAQNVKKIIERLRAEERAEDQYHRVVYRPWGHFDSIEEGQRFKVKRITVKPGAKLSVQMHHHRAEHWIVVSGTARVTKGEETVLLSENESIYMPVGAVHALENPGVIPLDIIEVQTGSYLGEDDIVRFEDRYGRTEG